MLIVCKQTSLPVYRFLYLSPDINLLVVYIN